MKRTIFIFILIQTLNGNNILKPLRFDPPSRIDIELKNVTELNDAERMLAGLPYNANDINLSNGRIYAKQMCQKYNNMDPLDDRDQVLKELLGTHSKGNYIEPPFYCDYGSNIHLGENVYMNHGCILLDVNEIRIGKNTFLGPNVQIYTAGHPTDPILRRKTEFGKAITIGRDSWIGGSAIILPGITIGDGVTIGAGSVVTKDIESFTVAVGNPARVIKRLNITNLND
ncbi:maltose acetyltransferase [Brachionus plicatilis]|uniref:Maltose acetyltransferase n=1 Tax=Brachionus plicatilis TaxID=10195 RepID=A0A3M7ST16_BRAPC|nr:maltose acetyltransferase [Brachionus plicatilis]